MATTGSAGMALNMEKKLMYSEAFCFFQGVPKPGRPQGKLEMSSLPEALGAMGMALPTDSRVWAKILKQGKFDSLYLPKHKLQGYIDFCDYVFLLEKAPAIIDKISKATHRRSKNGEDIPTSKKEKLFDAFETFDPDGRGTVPEATLLEPFETMELDADANEFKELLRKTGLKSYSSMNMVDYHRLTEYLLAEDADSKIDEQVDFSAMLKA